MTDHELSRLFHGVGTALAFFQGVRSIFFVQSLDFFSFEEPAWQYGVQYVGFFQHSDQFSKIIEQTRPW